MIWRIRDRATFERLRREGRRVRAGVLWCTFVPDPQLQPPRVAFAIGRAVGPAVVRNRCRRRLRALLTAAPPPPGAYLLGVHPGTVEHTFDVLREDLAAVMASIIAATHRRPTAPPTMPAAMSNPPGGSPGG